MNYINSSSDKIKLVAKIFSAHLYKLSEQEVINLYKKLEVDEKANPILKINELRELDILLHKKEGIHKMGIDLPIFIKNDNKDAATIMLIGLDPKRGNDKRYNNDDIIIGSVFNIHSEKGREASNNYWNFIAQLIENNSLYITDLYKLYFEYNKAGKNTISHNDKEFTEFNIKGKSNNYHEELLQREISEINPKIIITLGKLAKEAILKFNNIDISTFENVFYEDYITGIKYFFLPHISPTVTNNITTIMKLFLSIGELFEHKILQDKKYNVKQIGLCIEQNSNLFKD